MSEDGKEQHMDQTTLDVLEVDTRIAAPIGGAMKLGVPQWTLMLLVALVSALMVWGLVMFVRQDPSLDSSGHSV